jgi:hypothetical protein
MTQKENAPHEEFVKSGYFRSRIAVMVTSLVAVLAVTVSTVFVTLLWQKEAARRELSRERQLAVQTGYVFPSLRDVESIRVRMCAFDEDAVIEFAISERDWPALIAGMTPSEYDPRPAAWPALAKVIIVGKDGKTISLCTYALEDYAVGAFSISDRAYYRGGNTKSLKNAMLKAYSNAKANGQVRRLDSDQKSEIRGR